MSAAIAEAMRNLPEDVRDAAIAASPNVIDKRDFFQSRFELTLLSRSYRKPQGS